MSESKNVKTLTIDGTRYRLVPEKIDGNETNIKLKRALSLEMPVLEEGEIGITTDINGQKLYIGTKDGNQLVGKCNDAQNIFINDPGGFFDNLDLLEVLNWLKTELDKK